MKRTIPPEALETCLEAIAEARATCLAEFARGVKRNHEIVIFLAWLEEAEDEMRPKR